MDTLLQETKFAVRRLLAQPAFTCVAILSLALGIGANTAIFTVINAVFLHPLAIEDPSSVVELFTHDTKTAQVGNFNLTPTSLQNYEDYRDRNDVFSGLAAYNPIGLQWTTKGGTEPLPGMMTSANYFNVLGIKPHLGRFFLPDEDLKTASQVAVLSYNVWTNRFGADRSTVGKTITLNGLPFTVIGVAPPGFKGTASLAGADRVWVPLGLRDQLLTGQIKALSTNRRFRWIGIVGRLRQGMDLRQARSALKVVAASLEKEFPDANKGRTIEAASVSDAALGINNKDQFRSAGGVMMVVVGLVLLVACVNLANLLLAQAARREKDISISAALGASRLRIIGQLLTETLILSIAGGALGLLVAYWGRNALWSFRPPFLNNASIDLTLDRTVLLFTLAISILTGIIFGLVPAVKLSRVELTESLKLGGRTGTLGLGRGRLRSLLVVSEIALATVALIGAGLFVRSMQAAENMDIGFDSKHIAFMGLNPALEHYDEARGQQFYVDAVAQARAIPGVKGAAVASIVPAVGGGGVLMTVFREGETQDTTINKGSLMTFSDVSPGYFSALGIPIKRGRDFTQFDRKDTTLVAILNEAAVKMLWPGQDAIGKRFTIVQETELYEVIGVVQDSVMGQVGEDPVPVICRPLTQQYAPAVGLIVRTANDDPSTVLGPLRDRIRSLDSHMPLRNVGTIQEQIEQGLWAPRMGAALLSIFGGLALVLAMIGIYGVMAYSVAQRTPEIGFRMAVGAQPRDVLGMVMRQGMLLAGLGAAAGVVVAIMLGRLIAGLLFGIQPYDPVALGGVIAALCVVALVACYLPARRATRVDPITALRTE